VGGRTKNQTGTEKLATCSWEMKYLMLSEQKSKKTEDDRRFSRGNLRPGARPLNFAARSKNGVVELITGARNREGTRAKRDLDARNKTERRIKSRKNQINALRLAGKILREEIEKTDRRQITWATGKNHRLDDNFNRRQRKREQNRQPKSKHCCGRP
jgi:hypothetical protein